MKSKKLILAGSIALALSGAQFAHGADGLVSNAKHHNTISATQATSQESAYYVRYKKGQKPQLQLVVQQMTLRSQPIIIRYELDDYDTVVIVAADADAQSLAADSSVDFMEPVPEHRMLNQVVPWNVDQFQARDLWDKDRNGTVDTGAPDGNGFKVCIIDSGFYAAHDDFQGMNYAGMSQIPGQAFTEDGGSHGTHVAGTINAMSNNIGVVGVMPGGASLHIIKVFNNSGTWVGGSSNLGAAATACKNAGANVINMSLGGGYSSTENNIFQDLYDNHNIISVAAAGNDGNATRSYPASYDSVISVGGLNIAEGMYTSSQHPATSYDPNTPPAEVEWDVVELAAGGEQVLSTVSSINGGVPIYQVTNAGTDYFSGQISETGPGDVTQNMVDGGLCDIGDVNASWNGSVVLCERGAINFSAKMNNVATAGGEAVVLFNNESGALNATCSGGCTSGATIPGVTILQSEGQYLKSNGLGLPTRVLADDGSGCVGCTGGYDFFSGTSMASPGAAGAISLIWNACGGPTALDNKEVRQLVRDSAKDLTGIFDPTGTPYGAGWDPYTGWGLPQTRDAVLLGQGRFGASCSLGGIDLIFKSGFESDIIFKDGFDL